MIHGITRGDRNYGWRHYFLLAPFLFACGSVIQITFADDNQKMRLAMGATSSVPGASAAVATQISGFLEDDNVSSIEFSSDSSKVAVSTFLTQHIHIWEIGQGRPSVSATIERPKGGAFTTTNGLRYSPDGRQVAVTLLRASKEEGFSVVRVFDGLSTKAIRSINEPQGGGVYSRIEYLPNSGLLIRTYDAMDPESKPQFFAHSADSLEVMWDLKLNPLVVVSLAVSADGKFAAVGGYLNVSEHPCEIRIIDIQSRKVVGAIATQRWENGVEQLSWHPDGDLIAAGGTINSVGKPAVQLFQVSSRMAIASELTGPAHLQAVRFSPDGQYLIECGLPDSVRIWDARHKVLLQKIPAKECYSMAISRDGEKLAISDQQSISIWHLSR